VISSSRTQKLVPRTGDAKWLGSVWLGFLVGYSGRTRDANVLGW
jgi:hypothetical protein